MVYRVFITLDNLLAYRSSLLRLIYLYVLPLCLMGFHDKSILVVFVVDRFVADWKISPVYEQQ